MKAIRHGIKNESVAVALFEDRRSIKTMKCGTFIHPDYPYLASSPDRLVTIEGETMVVEVKCPYSARNDLVSEHTISYLQRDSSDNLALDPTHIYYYQVQGQMACTGLDNCIFIVYTPFFGGVYTEIHIKRDNKFITEMITKLRQFFEEHFKKALLEAYLYKSFKTKDHKHACYKSFCSYYFI